MSPLCRERLSGYQHTNPVVVPVLGGCLLEISKLLRTLQGDDESGL